MKIIPFLIAIVGGYLVSITLGMVDFSPVLETTWFGCLASSFPLKLEPFRVFELYFGPEMLAILQFLSLP